MRKKIAWIHGSIDNLSCEIKKKLDELNSYLFQVEDKIKVFFPEDKEQDISKITSNQKSFVKSGDKGCGLPGTIEWHTTQINQKEPIEIGEYVKKLTGEDINILGRIDYTKKRAMEAIEDHLNGNCK